VKLAVMTATNSWLALQIFHIHGMKATPANAWSTIKNIRNGKSITKKLDTMTLRKVDGTLCTTLEENSAAMAAYLTAEFGKKGVNDQAAITSVRQRDRSRWKWLDRGRIPRGVTQDW
jgi:hypothetical protein